MKKYIILFVFLCTGILNAQSLSVFDVDTTNFPIMSAKFYAWDENWEQIKDINADDVRLLEDGVKRNDVTISCPDTIIPSKISLVLMIDKSGSMMGDLLLFAKATSKSWVAALGVDEGEIAICSFDEGNYINQDFTNNKERLYHAIDEIGIGGNTDFDAGFIDPAAGALVVAENA